ncbi:MAG: hypothetical protein M1820_010861 [Bogoriella megaspora]|nr:MAG: hypothetical protein M1820_010861 [Bogoriella megaspora]
MYDVINDYSSSTHQSPYCLAFEWMDCTLKDVPSKLHEHNSALHKSISGAILGALAGLKSQRLVHTDIKNDNILISSIDGPSPVVKLGDLGLVRSDGFNEYPVQPYAMRAPEVWSGLGCFHRSDLFDWISPCVFGANDMAPGHWREPWAMAKLLRLFPRSLTAHPTDLDYKGYFELAQLIERFGHSDETEQKCFETLSFEEELGKLDVPPALSEVFRYLLVVDHKRRPTAVEALKSREFQRLG